MSKVIFSSRVVDQGNQSFTVCDCQAGRYKRSSSKTTAATLEWGEGLDLFCLVFCSDAEALKLNLRKKNRLNTVSESTASNTELSEVLGPHQALGGRAQ